MSAPLPVVVVGAGPAGAALGWILASRDQSVVLVERQSDFERFLHGTTTKLAV